MPSFIWHKTSWNYKPYEDYRHLSNFWFFETWCILISVLCFCIIARYASYNYLPTITIANQRQYTQAHYWLQGALENSHNVSINHTEDTLYSQNIFRLSKSKSVNMNSIEKKLVPIQMGSQYMQPLTVSISCTKIRGHSICNANNLTTQFKDSGEN